MKNIALACAVVGSMLTSCAAGATAQHIADTKVPQAPRVMHVLDQPFCPTEDSCRPTYEQGIWTIEQIKP